VWNRTGIDRINAHLSLYFIWNRRAVPIAGPFVGRCPPMPAAPQL